MAKQSRRAYPVIDIGTKKTVVLVVVEQGEEIKIYENSCENSGLLKGSIVTNAAALEKCVISALSAVELKAGFRLRRIHVTMSGGDVRGRVIEGKSALCAADKGLQDSDVKIATDNMLRQHLPAGSSALSLFELPFLLDDKEVPQGILTKKTYFGKTLTVQKLQILASKKHVDAWGKILLQHNTAPGGWFAAGIASGLAMSSGEPGLRDRGLLVIDIGAGTSDYVLYHKGIIRELGVLPVGGDHVTADLMEGLHLDRQTAEELKVKHASAIVREEKLGVRLWTRGDKSVGDREVYQRSIDQITHARMEELFQCIQKRLAPFLKPELVRAGVVLTGGTSRLLNVEKLAVSVLRLSVRRATYPSWVPQQFCSPQYSTALGMVELLRTQPLLFQRNAGKESIWKRIWRSLS
ncbi:MAG: rod shape-determining protein [Puniceicoccales bacterium]|jgi:cell division protein FtsA|nr:rod shape-determining protein [Puniceicoccales bacterium]